MFLHFPKRAYYIFHHFSKINITNLFKNKNWKEIKDGSFYWWWILLCQILDLFGISEIYETICDFSKKKTRPLSLSEVNLAMPIFGNSIDYQRVRIDETAQIACKNGYLKYVSFYTINSWGKMRPDIIIHELVHVWQYQKFGAAYIPLALKVHLTDGMSYNYGGAKALKKALLTGKKFTDFNFEQQGDIVADYFRIKNGYPPIWGFGTAKDLSVYEKLISEIRN